MELVCTMMIAMTLAGEGSSGFAIRSAALRANGAIPSRHTCDDADTSPALMIPTRRPATGCTARTRREIEQAIGEHQLAKATLTGTYHRAKR